MSGRCDGIGSRANGGKASVRGFEASVAAAPTSDFTVGASVSYSDARIDETVAALGAVRGDPLPNAPRWSGSVTVDYDRPISGDIRLTGGGALRFASDRNTSFPGAATQPNVRLDGYALLDLRAGVRKDRFELFAFVRNATDSRAELGGRNVVNLPEVVVARPRTIGLAFSITG